MYLIVTIDTEEDNWGDYRPTGCTLENIKRLPSLQGLFDAYDVKPTYLVTSAVATNAKAVSILKGILKEGKCEIGSHCHPWNTPPFEEKNTIRNSMLCNLPAELQYRKLESLHNMIRQNFGIQPISFRAGRWGYSQEVANNLHKLGYRIETSMTPFVDWKDDYGPDFSDILPLPFKFFCENVYPDTPDGAMLEVPVTIGFLQENFSFCKRLLNLSRKNFAKKFHLMGCMYRLNLLNRVWLSPEFSNSREMIKLAEIMAKKNYQMIHMTFHSPSLKAGLSPFVKSNDEEVQFLQRLKEFLAFTHDSGMTSITLADIVHSPHLLPNLMLPTA